MYISTKRTEAPEKHGHMILLKHTNKEKTAEKYWKKTPNKWMEKYTKLIVNL